MEYVYTATILIVSLFDSLTCQKISFIKCDDGWLMRRSQCYKWGSSPQTYSMAVSECQSLSADLQMMFNKEENAYFMVNDESTESLYWLGLKVDFSGFGINWKLSNGKKWSLSQYGNWYKKPEYFSGSRTCVEWNSLTGKWQMGSCVTPRNFLCQKSAECVNGRYGTDCSNECHCLGPTCNPLSGICPYGCSVGWIGRHCDKRKTKAKAIFYCISTPLAKRNEMIFSGDQNGIHYRRIRALDKRGNPVDACNSKVFTFRDSSRIGQVMLTLVKAEHGFEPKCGEEKISNNTYMWRFQFKEFPVTRSAYDVTFEVQCNFSAAENLQRSAEMSNQVPGSQSEHLSETRLSVSLDIADVITNKHVRTATIGQPVKLVMELKDKNAIGVKRVAPHSCTAGTEDGSQGIVFVDDNGCPKQGAQVVFSKGNGTNWWSERFDMFSFSGSDHVVFTCSFDICFSDEDKNCLFDRCTRNETMFPETGIRARRALKYLLTGEKLVGAKVKVKLNTKE